jgi:hypothetical protein
MYCVPSDAALRDGHHGNRSTTSRDSLIQPISHPKPEDSPSHCARAASRQSRLFIVSRAATWRQRACMRLFQMRVSAQPPGIHMSSQPTIVPSANPDMIYRHYHMHYCGKKTDSTPDFPMSSTRSPYPCVHQGGHGLRRMHGNAKRPRRPHSARCVSTSGQHPHDSNRVDIPKENDMQMTGASPERTGLATDAKVFAESKSITDRSSRRLRVLSLSGSTWFLFDGRKWRH